MNPLGILLLVAVIASAVYLVIGLVKDIRARINDKKNDKKKNE